ncbi:hypothetical protein WMF27_00795 [Sorangium sp. So ce281]|uniref:hypothetical protein n=1 Tax=unclassified Sorangium TaxID=2621164 RepID=UPI003F640E50
MMEFPRGSCKVGLALATLALCAGLAGCGDTADPPDDGVPPTTDTPTVYYGVDTRRELMITSLAVVNDPVRAQGMGAWTFGKAMTEMAPEDMAPADFVESWVKLFQQQFTVNGFPVGSRSAVDKLLSSWPRQDDGKLDLSKAPFRLTAIVNRMDLLPQEVRRGAPPGAGEGRFVFGLVQDGEPANMTVIFEYALVGPTEAEASQWACAWHALGTMPLGSPEYNEALQAITDKFSKRGSNPDGVNGSALHQVRTNDVALTKTSWELREFNLDPETGLLRQVPLDRTPDDSFDGTERLAQFIKENQDAILSDSHNVGDLYQDEPFRGSTSHIPMHPFDKGWVLPSGSGIDANLRHAFSLSTCNGCHSGETRTNFAHVSYDHPMGEEAILSGYLTGVTVIDPIDGESYTFNELEARAKNLSTLLQQCDK